MSEDREYQEYLTQIHTEVIERSQGYQDDDEATTGFKEDIFTELMLEELVELGVSEDATVCYHQQKTGSGIIKANAYAVDDDDGRVDLFVSEYAHSVDPVSIARGDVQKALERSIRLYDQAQKEIHLKMEPASDQYSMMQRLCEVGESTDQLQVYYLTDGLVKDHTAFALEHADLDIRCQIWDLQRLYRCRASGLPYEAIQIHLSEFLDQPLTCLSMPDRTDDYDAYLTIIPGELLYRLYDEYGSRLLELNVRSFLQARGKVNKGIRNTLHDEPSRFLAYNNGISITAEELELVQTNGSTAIASIRGMQIVNGGQTVASIHRERKNSKADISDVFVQAKITVIDPETIDELVPKISRFSNTQNRVNEADFSSNDAYHVEIQRLSESIWAPGEQSRWFYERARGQYQVAKSKAATTPARRKKFETATPSNQKITKTDLAKYVNAWDQLPHVVSLGAQKNFVKFMDRLHGYASELIPDEKHYKNIIAKAIIFKQAEKIARQHKFPAYRANAVAYTVSYLSYRTLGRVNLDAIWQQQCVSDALINSVSSWMFDIWNEIIESAGEKNVTEWCKKEACWQTILQLSLPVPQELQDELAEGQPLPTVGSSAGQAGKGLTEEDRENIARVMQVPAKDWLQIHSWGLKTGEMHPRQAGIALTLAGYASTGWQNVPSAKQAAAAMKILSLASESPDLDLEGGENSE